MHATEILSYCLCRSIPSLHLKISSDRPMYVPTVPRYTVSHHRAGSIYSWTIPGGAAIIGDPSAASVTVVFGNVGGTIQVRETNIAGCITNHNPLTVTVRPLPAAIISGGGTICEGGSAISLC